MNAFLPDEVWWPLGIGQRESLLSFSTRTMDHNVLPHIAALLREAGQVHRNRFVDVVRGDVPSEALAVLLGLPFAEVARRRGVMGPDGRFRYMGIEMRPEDVCTRVRRFTPAGLAERLEHRASWTLRQLPFCAETWQPLIHRCDCGAVQDWTMVRDVAACQGCGGPLADVECEMVPVEWQPALRVYSDLLSGEVSVREAALARLPTDLGAGGSGAAVDMVLGLAPVVEPRLHRSVRHPGSWRDQPMLLASAIATVMKGVLSGPEATTRMLLGCVPADTTVRTRQLGRLSAFLLGRGRTLLPAACVAILDEAAAALVSPGPGDARAIDFAEAGALLGRTRRTLRAARRSGALRTAFFIRRGELLPALDRVEVERIASTPSSGPGTFGRRLHLPPYAVEQMAGSAVLRWIEHPFVLETQGIRIAQGEDARLIERLTAASVDLSGDDAVGLTTVLRSMGGGPKPYGPLFRALLDGEVAFEMRSAAMLVARIRVRLADVSALRAAVLCRPAYLTFPAPSWYTQMDACDILNLHVRSRAIILTLEHDRENGGLLVSGPAVTHAAQRFVTVGELAARLGRNAMTVAGELRKAGLRQVDGLGWGRAEAFSTLGLGHP